MFTFLSIYLENKHAVIMKFKYTLISLILLLFIQCKAQTTEKSTLKNIENKEDFSNDLKPDFAQEQILVGADSPKDYLALLKGKSVGVVTNQTGIIPTKNNIHLVDFLLNEGVNIKTIFSPEHGFRGKADAGELVKNGKDTKTGLSIISLYGKNKKPRANQLKGIDIILFDLQDVGVRFYTYISTLHYVMEACAENNIPVVVLDRPNPNAHYIDGPILNLKEKTFVGMHPVPIVYGMTIGEYAQMINGENWLNNGIKADLKVIKLKNYSHDKPYSLPIKPSPNLPNDVSVNLYPSICFFEGTNVSEGRGTDMQFQTYGSPYLKGKKYNFSFTPRPNEGAKNPQHNGKLCYGEDLRNTPRISEIRLDWLIDAYKNNTENPFFTLNAGAYWIDKLAGTNLLRKQIIAGWSEEKIKQTWQKDLEEFKKVRSKYLLYP